MVQTAELHDVGKLAIPDAVLHKQGPLNEEEWKLMRQHTVLGERMLAGDPKLAAVARMVRSCHERWDGCGYPDGLEGEATPLASRIVFACDAFDAMTSARPYQPPMDVADALDELERCAGTQFDPTVVRALVDELVSSARVAGREAPTVS